MFSSFDPVKAEQTGKAIRAFGEPDCTACGARKESRMQPFCGECMGRLTPGLLADVTKRSTYLETYHIARAYLDSLAD
jgi:hypothetical protein